MENAVSQKNLPTRSRACRWVWRVFCGFLGCVLFSVIAAVVVCSELTQRIWVTRILREQGIEAHFKSLSFGVWFSDEIHAEGVEFTFPKGERIRVEKFSAKHNGTRGLFSGTPSFRDFSCRGFSLDDKRGRRKIRFSCDAKEISASFLPWEPIAKFTLGSPMTFSVRADEFKIYDGGKILAQGSLNGDFLGAEPIALSGKISGDFSAVMAQPALETVNNVAAGTFELQGQGRTAQLHLRDLRSRYGDIEIPALSFFAERGDGVTGTLRTTLVGESSEMSSARVHFSHLKFGDGQLIFDGETEAETLIVSDIFYASMLFRGWGGMTPVELLPAAKKYFPETQTTALPRFPKGPKKKPSPVAPKSPVPAKSEPSLISPPIRPQTLPPAPIAEKAFWHGISGKMDFRAKRVVFPSNELGAHHGKFSASEKALAAEVEAEEFYGGNTQGKLSLTFENKSPAYRLTATLEGDKVELHNVFPILRESSQKPIEGTFHYAARISAAADKPENLEQSLSAEFSLKSSAPGTVRVFNAESKNVRLAENLVRLGSGLSSMLGKLSRNIEPRATRFADAFDTLKTALTDFRYDKIFAVGGYRAGGDIYCSLFQIDGEMLRVSGRGGVRPIAGELPQHYPLKLSAEIFARGDAEEALGVIGIIPEGGERSEDGFVLAKQVEFTGTAAEVSANLWDALKNAASGKSDSRSREEKVPAKNLLDAFVP